MELPKDPIMLMSFLNTKLRNLSCGLDALCEDLDADRAELEEQLAAAGFIYNEQTNQFR